MQSSWSITYSGPHHGVMLKKLERVGKFAALEVKRERLLIQNVKVEHASFLMQHESNDWPSLVLEVLTTAGRLFPVWQIAPGRDSVHGSVGDVISGYRDGYKLPVAGLRSISWKLNAEQHYVRVQWLGEQPNQW